MRTRTAGLLAGTALGLAACGQAGAAAGDIDRIDRDLADHPDTVISETAAGFDAFGFALLDELMAGAGEPNVALSPLSAGAALSLILAGAGGQTAGEIADVLGVEEDAPAEGEVGALLLELADTDDVHLALANAVWTTPGYPLTDRFRETATGALGASVDELDLSDVDEVTEIDEWANNRTGGLIDEITEALGLPRGNAVAVLANATHFAGTWSTEFDPDDTRDGTFTRDDGSTVTAELMESDDMPAAVATAEDGDTLLARLPYGEDGRFGFEVLLPADGTPVGEALDGLGDQGWSELSEQASEADGLRVVLPRFTVSSEHDLTGPLHELGMRRAFGNGHDFTPMSLENPFLETVVQKAVVEVDESGTEAAAVTGGVMVESAPMLTEVVVDRSFAFAVRDTATGAALFLGVVDDPGA
ncbi:serpin family protein [Haloechinothrix sp. LS1_15]|uniref:serpin family protein n=1 Tax=Haloechinothrix sp. LS1_15 TaxID=2652248 RepID=UPI002944B0E2|nr:serpin family protein [Haloechinothrix sp. LS1_15]MDV6013008.1 serpin family protein [Haloechinothrix sp. LS1_15]